MPQLIVENIEVPEHTTQRLTLGDWTFTSVRTGCIRVTNGSFTAYIPVGKEGMHALSTFILDHIIRTWPYQWEADHATQDTQTTQISSRED